MQYIVVFPNPCKAFFFARPFCSRSTHSFSFESPRSSYLRAQKNTQTQARRAISVCRVRSVERRGTLQRISKLGGPNLQAIFVVFASSTARDTNLTLRSPRRLRHDIRTHFEATGRTRSSSSCDSGSPTTRSTPSRAFVFHHPHRVSESQKLWRNRGNM